MIIGAVAFVLLLILLFGRNSRDERGRKIIGKAASLRSSAVHFRRRC